MPPVRALVGVAADARHPRRPLAAAVHRVDLEIAVAVAREADPVAAGRPAGVQVGGLVVGQTPRRAARRIDGEDLHGSVSSLRDRAAERDRLAVRRPGRVLLEDYPAGPGDELPLAPSVGA